MAFFAYTPGNGKLAAIAVLVLIATPGVWAQLSPGPLSRGHRDLNGLNHCVDCHRFGSKQLVCLDCHKEIAERLQTKRGLHPALMNGSVSDRDCRRCHVEHKGEETPLIRWEPSQRQLDHTKTGYVLEGKHATLACDRCHTPKHLSAGDISDVKIKDLKRTFLGLRRNCLACHEDTHRGQLAQDCERCHSFSEWKRPPRFDHEKARYVLTGGHTQVQCQKCHEPSANKTVKYTGLAFSRCDDCHRDPHRGRFLDRCDSCHKTSAWRNTNLAGKFDHQQTKYRLSGKHMSVGCVKCHAGADFKKQVAFAKCTDCHKPDPHSGQFAKRADRGECNACHNVEGFKSVLYGVREHMTSAYALEGKHSSVACAKCHLPAGRATRYRLSFGFCTDCHKDQHLGQFAGPPRFNRCEDCHTTQDFRASTFTTVRHQATRFPLTGAHSVVACASCHKRQAGRRLWVRYRFESLACAECHADPHRGQFRMQMAALRADGSVVGCQLCHSPRSWKVVRFSHTLQRFPLVGRHREAACIKCHKPTTQETPLHEVNYRAAPMRCEDCHEESHGGQFARPDGTTTCVDCHNSKGWRPSMFDHDRRTSYPLPGKHRAVKCTECHKNRKLVSNRQVVFFKSTPKECTACHRKPV